MSETAKYSWGYALLGALFFIPFLGGVHLFDWDEINFAEISREMLITGDFTRVYVNFTPFFQKPPFFFWLQALAMQLFGVGEFAARLPNALCGVATLVLLFRMGQRLYDTRFGIIWAGTYFGTVLPFLYFKSGIIDPWFNLFIFLGLYFFILFYWKKEGMPGIAPAHGKWYYLLLGGFFIGMGILTKGPVAYLIAVLTMGVYWVYQRFRLYISIPQFLIFTVMTTLVTLTWYGVETLKNGPEFIQRFNAYQVELFSTASAGHSGFPGYHFVVLLVGCFPASIFALRAFFRLPEEEAAHRQDFRIWMKFLFWTVLILFTIVRSKIVHYSSMCYFPITFLAAVVIYHFLRGELSVTRWMRAGLWATGGLYILLTVALPFIGMNAGVLQPLFDDPFARANLEAEVRWTGLEVIPGLFLFAVLFVSMRLLRGDRKVRSMQVLYGGTALFVMLTLIFFIKRIEGYSQRAAIEFFESKVDQDVYLISHGYKTYAHYFYGRVTSENRRVEDNEQWAITGDIDKEVFISSKIHRADELRALEDLEELYSKNGFVFFRRRPR